MQVSNANSLMRQTGRLSPPTPCPVKSRNPGFLFGCGILLHEHRAEGVRGPQPHPCLSSLHLHRLPANSEAVSWPCGNKDHATHRAGRPSCEHQAVLTPQDPGSFHLNPPPRSPRCGPWGSLKGRASDLKTNVSSSTYRRRPGDKRTVTVSFQWDWGLPHSHSTSPSGHLPLWCPHTAARL